MTSQMCIEDIEMMIEDGLKPTPQDIIRLNELALNFERKKSMNSFKSFYSLPRIAQIDNERWFRQPTLGHEIWLNSVQRFIDTNINTLLALYAFALSRDYTELPDAENQKAVVDAVNKFLEEMKDNSREQIYAALEYVQNGIVSSHDEYPEFAKSKNDDDDELSFDWDECIAVGVLNHGISVLHGITLAEMKSMTKSQLESIIERTLVFNDKASNDAKYELANYNRTLDKIKERLIKEKTEVE